MTSQTPRRPAGIERLTNGVERLTIPIGHAQPGRQEPLVESAQRAAARPPDTKLMKLSETNVIKSMENLQAYRDDPRYKEAFEILQAQSEVMSQEKAKDDAWRKYTDSKLALLSDLASKFTSNPAEHEMFFRGFSVLAGRISQNFYNEDRFNNFVSACYNIHVLNERDLKLRNATLNVFSKTLSNPNFDPSMISKLEEMTYRSTNGAALIGELRHFHSHLARKKEMTRETYVGVIELAEIFRYMDKELKEFADRFAKGKDERPVDRFEMAARIRGKLSHLKDVAIPDVLKEL